MKWVDFSITGKETNYFERLAEVFLMMKQKGGCDAAAKRVFDYVCGLNNRANEVTLSPVWVGLLAELHQNYWTDFLGTWMENWKRLAQKKYPLTFGTDQH